jgi:hypothetical protein
MSVRRDVRTTDNRPYSRHHGRRHCLGECVWSRSDGVWRLSRLYVDKNLFRSFRKSAIDDWRLPTRLSGCYPTLNRRCRILVGPRPFVDRQTSTALLRLESHLRPCSLPTKILSQITSCNQRLGAANESEILRQAWTMNVSGSLNTS